jgi:cytochrome b561
MHKRTRLKILHWSTAILILYFFLVEPEDVRELGAGALATHAGAGIILGLVVGSWMLGFLRNGIISKPGPKLPQWARKTHKYGYGILYIMMPLMVLSGAVTGFAAPYVIHAFDMLPINPGIGTKGLHEFAQDAHELVFNLTIATIVGHALFHLWRHFKLRDNALRIMVPKLLHRYL